MEHSSPESRSTSNVTQGLTPQKIIFVIKTAMGASNPTVWMFLKTQRPQREACSKQVLKTIFK
jgi:hypothetical protein